SATDSADGGSVSRPAATRDPLLLRARAGSRDPALILLLVDGGVGLVLRARAALLDGCLDLAPVVVGVGRSCDCWIRTTMIACLGRSSRVLVSSDYHALLAAATTVVRSSWS